MLRTPLRPSPWLSAAADAEVRLKLETLQPTFSYKIRGAFNAVQRLVEERGGDVLPLVTASAGNHGRALATAARAAGLPLTVYVPENAPRTKLDAIRSLGVDLQPCADYDEAERRAKDHAASGAALYISPYSHRDVIAGAGTVGLEILEDWPDVDVIVVPIGGGGLISGIAIAAQGVRADIDVHGVEVEASCPFTKGRAAGHIVGIDVRPTLADGLAGNLDPDTVTFDIVQRLVPHIAVVSEDDLRRAIRGFAGQEKLVVEGAGATAAAAVLSGAIDVRERRAAVVVSGANIDMDKLASIVAG
ncbi:MAG TPA: pyridoxal-phosphate dependent enzyme, partial [Vicinamibacterales bacterium]|nr:pyridoxal-phosphate dependent enzyme [Vicinamibacterales bacterium]